MACLHEIKAVDEKRTHGVSHQSAFTLLEVIVISVTFAVLAAVILPRMTRIRKPASHLKCVYNMKNIGLAYRTWAVDHSDLFPMGVSTNQEGTSNYVGTPDMFPHFQVLSNEIGVPKFLVCPALYPNLNEATQWVTLQNSNLDYFVGVDAQPDAPNSILAGDRFLTTDASYSNNLLHLRTNSIIRWQFKPHTNAGNVAFGDGHVEGFTSDQWRRHIEATATNVTRLAMPK